MKEIELRREALPALERCLAGVPGAQVRPKSPPSPDRDRGIDLLASLVLPPDREVLLLVELERSGQPKPVRDAINFFVRIKQDYPNAYPVVLAPYLSARSADLCKQAGVGYVDLAGNCRLAFDGVYIQREGRPNPFTDKRTLRSLYSPRATRILRVLLLSPRDKRWRMERLAAEADVSLGLVANVKKLLDERDWLRVGPDGFALSDPGAVLAEWAEVYDYRRNRAHDFYSMREVADTEDILSRAARGSGIAFAFTAFSAAARLAPVVRYQRITAYVAEEVEQLARRAGLRSVASGANVTLLTPYDDGVFNGMAWEGESWVVSPVQAYLDVQSMRGRGEEAATALLAQVLRPRWQE